jgi:hypothetical protein
LTKNSQLIKYLDGFLKKYSILSCILSKYLIIYTCRAGRPYKY